MPFPRQLPKKREPINYRFPLAITAGCVVWSAAFAYFVVYKRDLWPLVLQSVKPTPLDPRDPRHVLRMAEIEEMKDKNRHFLENSLSFGVSKDLARATEVNVRKEEVGNSLHVLAKLPEFLKSGKLESGQVGNVVITSKVDQGQNKTE